MKKTTSGFTIVEFLIVIVVIAILASISIVAYNGVQGRARDAKRQSDLKSIANALELYRADNGGYPIYGATGTYSGSLSSSTLSACLAGELVPAYMASLPTDPVNVSPAVYWYGVGYRKTGTNSYTGTPPTDNYIIGAIMDVSGGPNYSGWGITANYLIGSSN